MLESRRLVGKLKDNGVEFESMFISQEGGMAHLDNRVEVMQRVEAFLAKHL